MTANRPRPIKKTPPASTGVGPDKPYALISFPKQRPTLKPPVGHHRYADNSYHGILYLTLRVKTALHISTGIVAMGSDVGSRVPLIKTMVQGRDKRLLIQGSSLKGCVRAIYEAITNSTLGVITKKYRQQIPPERRECSDKEKLCPASQIFGALNWQGLVHFTDAHCQSAQVGTGFMPSLHAPKPDKQNAYYRSDKRLVAGRKFYYHTIKAVDTGNQGIPVQQAGTDFTFTTQLQVMNLSQAQLGALLVALGQDEQYPIALKLGGGKPVGLGTVLVEVSRMEITQNVRDRYRQYEVPESAMVQGQPLKALMQKAIQAAHREKLIEEPQLKELSQILQWPTSREAPTGMY